MDSLKYKGHKIYAKPCKLPESQHWAIEFQIASPKGDTIVAKIFSAVNTYKTEKEAALHSLNLGKQIIDSRPIN
jgi:hypothetical protein